MTEAWAELFVGRGGTAASAAPEPLQARLEQIVAEAGMEADDAIAASLVAELARRSVAGEPWELGGESAQELGLACSCVMGNRAALARLDARYLSVVTPAIAHMGLGAATIEEIQQDVRRKLLVPGADGEPKLVRYAGRGKLRGLVKVVATRAAVDRVRRQRGEPAGPGDELDRLAAPGRDPELDFLKARYREAFSAAFARAVQQLPRRDRNVLRLHLLGGMTLEEVAKVYGVHRSTVVRGLARTRKQLFAATRDALREGLALGRDEFDSVMRLIQSRLDVSLDRLLQTITPSDAEDESPPSE